MYKLKNFRPFLRMKFAFQRVRRGWADEDTWNIDTWFCKVLPEMLEYLANNHQGTTFECVESAEKDAAIGIIKENEIDDESSRRWEEILRCMANYIREGSEATRTKKNKYEDEWLADWDNKEISKKFYDEEIVLNEYSKRCLSEGLKLFEKYFYDLWD